MQKVQSIIVISFAFYKFICISRRVSYSFEVAEQLNNERHGLLAVDSYSNADIDPYKRNFNIPVLILIPG